MEKHKKVIVWGRKDVLGGAFESLLSSLEEWIVFRITDDRPREDLFRLVEQEKPDVVILYAGSNISTTLLPVLLMQMQPRLRVITVSLQDNNVEVYDKHKICIKNVEDLYAAIDI